VFTQRFSLNLAIAAAALTVTALLVGAVVGQVAEEQRTAIFLTLGLGQLGVALAIRSRPARRRRKARGLELATGTAALLLVAGSLLGPLQALLGTQALEPLALVTAVLAAVVPGLLVRFAVNRDRSRMLRSEGPR
jgi:Ca2+-transporting ATPase